MARKKRTKKWIQAAIKRPGRTKAYLRRKFGAKAFTKDGRIKTTYLNKAIQAAKKQGNRSLLSALILAKRLKKGI